MTDSTPERPLGARYRLDQPDGSWWELGWDRPLATFYAQHYSPLPFDPSSEDDLLDWHGTDFAELATVDALAARLPVALPQEVKAELAADATMYPNAGPPRFLAAARDLAEALAKENRFAEVVAVGSPAPNPQSPETPSVSHGDGEGAQRWSLPAAPVADALRMLHTDPRLGDDDVTTFATGLGLDPGLVRGVLAGTVTDLGVDEIATVCDGLHCSPEQLWGTALADEISHAYGPEDWPANLEPLVEAEAAGTGRAGGPKQIDAGAVGGDGLVVLTVCYAQTGVLAVDETGHVEAVDDLTQPPKPHVEYHCRFRQVTNPAPLAIPIDDSRFAEGPRGHVDAEPALAEAAQRLRVEAWPARIDMVRFAVADDGAEQWLGWDARTTCWQTWDDPRSYYGGNPNDVLDPAGLIDVRNSPDPQLCLDEVLDNPPPSHHTDRFDLELTSSDSLEL